MEDLQREDLVVECQKMDKATNNVPVSSMQSFQRHITTLVNSIPKILLEFVKVQFAKTNPQSLKPEVAAAKTVGSSNNNYDVSSKSSDPSGRMKEALLVFWGRHG